MNNLTITTRPRRTRSQQDGGRNKPRLASSCSVPLPGPLANTLTGRRDQKAAL
jgi:hypothetical protein